MIDNKLGLSNFESFLPGNFPQQRKDVLVLAGSQLGELFVFFRNAIRGKVPGIELQLTPSPPTVKPKKRGYILGGCILWYRNHYIDMLQ